MRLLSEKHSVRQRRVSRIKVFSKKKKKIIRLTQLEEEKAQERNAIFTRYIGGI